MFRLGLCIAALLIISQSAAQNLVQNPGLETPAECPLTGKFGFFHEGPCQNWTSPKNGTPDYYNLNCGSTGSQTTTNNSQPHNGNAFGGLYIYGKFGNGNQTIYNREYIQGELVKPLTKGSIYTVSFWVKPVISAKFGIAAGIAEISICFSNTQLQTGTNLLMEVEPQVTNNTGAITDLNQWTEIRGCFTATGDEKYFTIGNFLKDEDNIMQPLPGAFQTELGYVLLDDVSVEEISKNPIITDSLLYKCAGDTLNFEINNQNFKTFLWNDGIKTAKREFVNPGWYSVSVVYNNYCVIEDSIEVKNQNCTRCEFFVPEAISPDENALNDHFELVSSCELRKVQMQIYTRWGEVVFDASSLKPSWDGSAYGKTLPEGVYIYKITAFYEEKGVTLRKNINGVVTLLR